jgi:protein required for attachment to host cells
LRNYWILVADGARARLLSSVDGVGRATLLREFINQSQGSSVPLEPAQMFAESLASLLEGVAVRHGFHRLVLVAAEDFLPRLTAALGPVSSHRLAWSIARNMTGAKLPQLERLLGDLLGAEPARAGS